MRNQNKIIQIKNNIQIILHYKKTIKYKMSRKIRNKVSKIHLHKLKIKTIVITN